MGLGQYLSGTATFAKEDVGKKVDVYNFKYILPEGSKKKEKEKDKGKKKAEDAAAYEEALRDCKISWLAKLGSQDLYSELLKAGGESSVITSIHAAKLANMLAVDAAEKKWKDIVLRLASTSLVQPPLPRRTWARKWMSTISSTSFLRGARRRKKRRTRERKRLKTLQ